jgi:hypothetical protein
MIECEEYNERLERGVDDGKGEGRGDEGEGEDLEGDRGKEESEFVHEL